MNEKKRNILFIAAEMLFIAGVLFSGFHFLQQRIALRLIPSGDEGSWMAVAAELARGNGFTTRWLEHSFLTPYTLPRPDDYRYPGLTIILSLAFRLFGISYETALQVIAALFLLFCLAVYILCRYHFGMRTAGITLCVTIVSLLHLQYNSAVYTEGLFGIITAWIVFSSIHFRVEKPVWWISIGLSTGLLYLVRPNGVLLVPALIISFSLYRKQTSIPMKYLLHSILLFFAVISPWLVRNYVHFGNPFHIAGSAGLLRAAYSEPLTLSFSEFVSKHGITYFLSATMSGIKNFFVDLDFHEHGLEIIPLGLAFLAISHRHVFYNHMVLFSIAISFFASAYTSNMSWAGVRYFSPFLPFVYAYGISFFFNKSDRIIESLCSRSEALSKTAGFLMLSGIALFPVLFPHRFYGRQFTLQQASDKSFYSDYYSHLNSLLGESGYYYAGSLAQLNFATQHNCIGMQYFFNAHDFMRAFNQFAPPLIVLTEQEMADSYFVKLLQDIKNQGLTIRMRDQTGIICFLEVSDKEHISHRSSEY